ncbi:MAG: DUF2127 domain-containing protein [Candidatus Shapirobacteria bacterium]
MKIIKFIIGIFKKIGRLLHKSAKIIFRIFEVSIIIKGIDGFLEILGSGILFYVSNSTRIDKVILMLTEHELSQDPNDFIATHILSFGQTLSVGATLFGAIYLLAHGVLKIFMVTMLLQKKLWAYPVVATTLIIFASYQIYRYTHTHAPLLIFFSCFDLFTALLTILVYRELKKDKV